jgi:hypothetical protein
MSNRKMITEIVALQWLIWRVALGLIPKSVTTFLMALHTLVDQQASHRIAVLVTRDLTYPNDQDSSPGSTQCIELLGLFIP